jgi:hypothetical protein
MVPLLVYHKGITVQAAIHEVAHTVKGSYQTFQTLEHQITQLGQNHNIADAVQVFLQSCKDCCVGALHHAWVEPLF